MFSEPHGFNRILLTRRSITLYSLDNVYMKDFDGVPLKCLLCVLLDVNCSSCNRSGDGLSKDLEVYRYEEFELSSGDRNMYGIISIYEGLYISALMKRTS